MDVAVRLGTHTDFPDVKVGAQSKSDADLRREVGKVAIFFNRSEVGVQKVFSSTRVRYVSTEVIFLLLQYVTLYVP